MKTLGTIMQSWSSASFEVPVVNVVPTVEAKRNKHENEKHILFAGGKCRSIVPGHHDGCRASNQFRGCIEQSRRREQPARDRSIPMARREGGAFSEAVGFADRRGTGEQDPSLRVESTGCGT